MGGKMRESCVYLYDKQDSKRKREPIVVYRDDVEDEELVKAQESFQDELEQAGFSGLFPMSFGKQQQSRKKTKPNQPQRPAIEIPIVSSNVDTAEVSQDVALTKYYGQRYSLFSKYDQGIVLDHEGWFSVTPEVIAEHLAERCRSDVIVDLFCGCGGNAIQFAQTCRQVIAIDIDPIKIECAKQNAKIYGVEDKIEWILGDAIQLLPSLRADVVFLSPPWGGPEYLQKETFILDRIRLGNTTGTELLRLAQQVTPNVAYYLPRNVMTHEIELAQQVCEYENTYLNDKRKTVTVYYGDLLSYKPTAGISDRANSIRYIAATDS